MEADHVEVLLGDRAPVTHKNIVHVLVMSIRHGHVREAAARLVHSVLRGVDRAVPVRIFLQKFGKCDLFRELASERKGVTNNSPLGLTEDAARSSAAQLQSCTCNTRHSKTCTVDCPSKPWRLVNKSERRKILQGKMRAAAKGHVLMTVCDRVCATH